MTVYMRISIKQAFRFPLRVLLRLRARPMQTGAVRTLFASDSQAIRRSHTGPPGRPSCAQPLDAPAPERDFPKIRVPYFGVLIKYGFYYLGYYILGSPIFGNPQMGLGQWLGAQVTRTSRHSCRKDSVTSRMPLSQRSQ